MNPLKSLAVLIPARYRKFAYDLGLIASAAVVALGQAGIIPADGAAQIGAVIAFVLSALASANTPA